MKLSLQNNSAKQHNEKMIQKVRVTYSEEQNIISVWGYIILIIITSWNYWAGFYWHNTILTMWQYNSLYFNFSQGSKLRINYTIILGKNNCSLDMKTKDLKRKSFTQCEWKSIEMPFTTEMNFKLLTKFQVV